MASKVMLYIGSFVVAAWGIAHLFPTRAVVRGFGPISEDNKKIITMESIAEGITLCFIGILVILVTSLADSQSQAAIITYMAAAIILFIMAILTLMTGARTSILPYKICPVVKAVVAVLIILGTTL